MSLFFFWFRPLQQEKKKAERLEAQRDMESATASKGPGPGTDAGPKAAEMQQLPPELPSPVGAAELPGARGISEAPGDGGGVELPMDSHPVELAGDHEYRSSDSIQSGR